MAVDRTNLPVSDKIDTGNDAASLTASFVGKAITYDNVLARVKDFGGTAL